ncbi:MAG: phosphatidylserine decarboxylase [Elusimicrobia bacterium ADurb.Bin231]|nr:MAG: phosphatidylserine decarboxylase [Elusimicrobia bacterium ADurb.Bin231]
MAKIGLRYAFIFFVFAVVFLFIGGILNNIFGSVFIILCLFCFYFFRDPSRKILPNENHILSPGDGRVFEISVVDEPDFIKGKAKLVKIFLSVFNVHLQRSPISGKVEFIKMVPGLVLKANHPLASEKNRQNLIGIRGKFPVLVKQIAGIIAQRCDLWVEQGADVTQGDKIGIIHFGSQVDIYLPETAEIKINTGDKVVGGITVIAAIKN